MGVSTDANLGYGIIIKDRGEVYERHSADEEYDYYDNLYSILKGSGCSLEEEGSEDCEALILSVDESTTCARRGHPEQITGLNVYPLWDQLLKNATDLIGVEYEEPKWILWSYWG